MVPVTASQLFSCTEQGALFGTVSALAVELFQLRLASEKMNWQRRSSLLGSAAARGALAGAIGGGLSFFCGPVVSTALVAGYGVTRECSERALGWWRREVPGRALAEQTAEALLGVAGGLSAAWAAGGLLSGLGGAAVAVATGCCGLAGSLAGRRAGGLLAGAGGGGGGALRAAYAELGLRPGCSRAEVRRAFRRAALARHPDRAALGAPGSHEAFTRLREAADLVHAARGWAAPRPAGGRARPPPGAGPLPLCQGASSGAARVGGAGGGAGGGGAPSAGPPLCSARARRGGGAGAPRAAGASAGVAGGGSRHGVP